MFLKLMFGWVTRGAESVKAAKGKARLSLEALEGRLVPAASVIAPQWFQKATVPAVTVAVSNLPRSQWIVELKDAHTNTLRTVNDAAKYFKTPAARIDVVRGLGEKGVFLVQGFGNTDAVKAAIQRLPGVKSVAQNTMIQAKTLSADPRFQELWGLDNQGQVINGVPGVPDADIDFPEAIARATIQKQIVVGVVDTGIDYNHPDLKDSMWVNPGEIAGNKRDDDGNGFVDDVYGYDFINNDSDPMDDFGFMDTYHGTHVAGTIAATINNSVGVAGIASNAAKLMALKIFNGDGYTSTLSIITAMNYSAMMRDRGIDIRVLNNSWGGGDYDSLEADAIKNVSDAGIMFVAAAGNDANDNDENPFYPANYGFAGMVSVAASDNRDELADFSNYGGTTVHLAAPGVDILSTQQGGRYQYLSGTSMAAPHVSGALALAWAAHPDVPMAELRDKLFASVDRISSLAGLVSTGGRLNVNNLLTALGDVEQPQPVVPAAPSNVRPDNVWSSKADIAWDDNSNNETGFRILVSADGGTTWNEVGVTGPDATRFRAEGLAPERSYTFGVQAIGSGGNSALARSRTFVTAPPAPTDVRSENTWARTVDIAWNDVSRTETGFRVYVSTNGGASWSLVGTAAANSQRLRVTDLSPSTTYQFVVRASGAEGLSELSNVATITTRSEIPAPPSGVRADNVWSDKVDVAWNDNSANETGFRVYYRTAGSSNWVLAGATGANATRFRVQGLRAGVTYVFGVQAMNGNQAGDVVSSGSVTTPVPTPDFSRMSISDVGRTSFRLNWRFNGSTPDHFEVHIEARGTWRLSENVPRDRSSALIEFEQRNGPRLRAGESYRVRIRAVDAAGRATSDWSETLTVWMAR